jgi:hypothetical protein
MKPNYIQYIYFLAILLSLPSCSVDDLDPEPENKFVQIASAASEKTFFDIRFYSEEPLFVGYNKVYFKLTDKSSGFALDQAAISLFPLMDMGTFKHACPVENPDPVANTDGLFSGAVLFSMPGSNNSWSLSAKITANGKTDSVYFPISEIVATSPVKKIVVIDSLSTGPGTWKITKHPVSLVEPPEWKVGNNTFEITVHTMASMMSFPCCNNLTVEITPEMPSMGHGSPNNVNPVLTEMGHYVGTVNFTMTGAWRINMVFKENGRIIGKNAFFDIVF